MTDGTDGLHDTYFLRKLYFESIKQHAESMRTPHFKDDQTYLKMRQRGELSGLSEIASSVRKYQQERKENPPETEQSRTRRTNYNSLESSLTNGNYTPTPTKPNSDYARVMTGYSTITTPTLEKTMRSYQPENHPYKPSPSVYFFS